jgi:hypothetical protein
MPTRRRRRARITLSGQIRRYLSGILFIGLGAFIVSVIGYITSIIPETTLTFTAGTSTVSISNTVLLNFIGFAAGIVFVLSGIRRLGIRF